VRQADGSLKLALWPSAKELGGFPPSVLQGSQALDWGIPQRWLAGISGGVQWPTAWPLRGRPRSSPTEARPPVNLHITPYYLPPALAEAEDYLGGAGLPSSSPFKPPPLPRQTICGLLELPLTSVWEAQLWLQQLPRRKSSWVLTRRTLLGGFLLIFPSIRKLRGTRLLMKRLNEVVSPLICMSSPLHPWLILTSSSYGVSLIEFDPVAERRLRLKIDLMIVPTVSLLYLFCFIDRANIGRFHQQSFMIPWVSQVYLRKCQDLNLRS
jgi:hypothetical protein